MAEGFNPDAYLAKTASTKSSFDPDKYLAKEPEKTSASKAFLIHAQDAASFGARSALGAAGESFGTGVQTLINTGSPSKAWENAQLVFNPARKELTQEKNKAFAEQPAASIAGNIGGNLLTTPLIAAKGISGAAKLGTLGGLGTAASEAESVAEAGKMIGSGAAVGGAFGAASKLGGMAAQGFKDAGSKLAFKTLGPGAKAAKVNLAKNQVEKIGEALLNEGIISKTPAGISKIADRLGKKLGEAGDNLGSVVTKLDDLAVQKGLDKYGVSTRKIAAEILKDTKVSKSIPGGTAINQQLKGFVKELISTNPDYRGIKDAEQFKSIIGKQIKWDRLPGSDIPVREQFLRVLYTKIKENSEKAALKVADASKSELSKEFRNSKSLFGLLKEAKKIVSDKEGRLLANNLLSPSDKAAGMLGLVAGVAQGEDLGERLKGAAIGASLGLANKAVRTGGTQLAAKGLYNVGDFLSKNANKNLGAIGRTAIQQSGNALSRRLNGEK